MLLLVLLSVLAAGCDWTIYLGDPAHSSAASDAGITPADAATLTQRWRWHPAAMNRPGSMYATPVTWHGRVYVTGGNGILVALDLATGQQLWSHDVGAVVPKECPEQGAVSSAAVRDDGNGNPIVYVYALDGYLYELDGLTGAVQWRSRVMIPSATVNDVFAWSSPTLANGRVYLGVSSQCDNPFVRGRVLAFDQVTGRQLASHYTMSRRQVGAGIWTSVAADSRAVYVTTGSTTDAINAKYPNSKRGNQQYSIVKLDPRSLNVRGKFRAPPTNVGDPDWGSSPVLFAARLGSSDVQMVGACNKDGYFYAVRTDTMALVWRDKVGTGTAAGETGCLSGAVWDGSRLFVASNLTTIQGTQYQGAVRRLDPATGAVLWARGLAANPLGAGAINPYGVIAVAATDWSDGPGNGIYLLDSATGAVLRQVRDSGPFPQFGQPVFADGKLLMANTDAVSMWSP